jgi:hypothetical protein
MGSGAGLGFGAGIAQGFARAYIGTKERRREEQRTDALREFTALFPLAVKAAEDTGDYAALEDFVGETFPKLRERSTARRAKAKAAQPKLTPPTMQPAPAQAPTSAAGAPTEPTTDIGAVAGTTPAPSVAATAPAGPPSPAAAPMTAGPAGEPAPLPSRQLAVSGTPAPPPDPSQSFMGFTMMTPQQRRQRDVEDEIDKLEQTRVAQMQLARRMLPELQKTDPSITLEDAMRYVSKGELMSAASQRQANMYRYGVDREALSKAVFGKAYDQLDRVEADIILREEQALIQRESEGRALGTGQGRFQAPMTAEQAQAAGVPAGTTSAQVAGQAIPRADEMQRRRSIEELQTTLADIRDRLLGPALPKKGELGELAPGAAYAIRRRTPAYRDQIASLEAAINNVVNVMARSVGEQRGTQTERDALRAEAAIAQIRDALFTGDTVESATARINESLKVLDRILGQLPNKPQPTAAGAAPAAPRSAPATSTTAPPARAGGPGPAAPGGAPKATKTDQGWVIQVP